MCGISGFNWQDKESGEKMNSCISHRGPDAEGIFGEEGITLSHKRLAIIDLSAAANQPMFDNDNNLVITFNGEIYNYRELRKDLESESKFKTHSDTEVILALYKKHGIEAFNKLNGIFSLAIWDRNNKTLTCARDHLGVKPFYYYYKNNKFIFSSEIKAILSHPIDRTLGIDSFNDYLRVLYVPEPKTMFQDIYKLPPGHVLVLSNNNLKIQKFFEPKINLKKWNYKDAVSEVKKGVFKAVERQLVSDVPVGVYLSGGIDSSAVLAGVKQFKSNVKTFSIGFDLQDGEEQEKFNKDFNLAKSTSKYFGSDHHELLISSKDVADTMVDIIGSIDDPISNPTAIPMAHLSKFAKQDVTVTLTGNGGDELFGGYERYRLSRIADLLAFASTFKKLLPQKASKLIGSSTLQRLIMFEFEKDQKIKPLLNPQYFISTEVVKTNFTKYIDTVGSNTEKLMLTDLKSWLPDQAMALGDRMSMVGSIEERVPFLDLELVELAMQLPINFKVTPFETKKILKDALRNDLPQELFNQPKRGWFSPGAKWLRRPEIEKIARNVLSKDYYQETSNVFDWNNIEKMIDGHINKREYNLTLLWCIMTFQIWAKKYEIKI